MLTIITIYRFYSFRLCFTLHYPIKMLLFIITQDGVEQGRHACLIVVMTSCIVRRIFKVFDYKAPSRNGGYGIVHKIQRKDQHDSAKYE